MTKPLTIPQLKKHLASLEKKELIALITQNYQSNSLLKQALNSNIQGDSYEKGLCLEYQEKLLKKTSPQRYPFDFDSKGANLLIAEFKKMKTQPRYLVQLQLDYVKAALDYTEEFGDIDQSFYNNLIKMYEGAADTVIRSGDEQLFEDTEILFTTCFRQGADLAWGVGFAFEEIYLDLLNAFSTGNEE